MRGIKLKNVEGMFKKSDPFFEIKRTYDGPGGGSWTPVFRSKHIKNNLNPIWEPATVDVNALCDGDLDRKLSIAIYDFESNGKHESMGAFDTTGERKLSSIIFVSQCADEFLICFLLLIFRLSIQSKSTNCSKLQSTKHHSIPKKDPNRMVQLL